MTEIRRSFRPGDPWAFIKVYCGETTAERLLRGDVFSLVDSLERDGLSSHWFFVRYADPAHHVRLRLYLPDPRRWPLLLDRANECFADALQDGLIWKVQADTYIRELERYGEETMELSERVFHRDSQMVLAALRLIHAAEDENLRWQFAMLAVARWLADCGYDPGWQFRIVDRLAKSLLAEHREPRALRSSIEQKYRERKQVIERLAARAAEPQDPLEALALLLDTRARETEADRRTLLERDSRGIPLDALVGSYLHMFCNRLFPTRQREHELLVYWFLAKYLRGQAARPAGG